MVTALPKEHSVFRFEIPPPSTEPGGEGQSLQDKGRKLVFELHGSQFENRAADRANRKCKQRNLPDL